LCVQTGCALGTVCAAFLTVRRKDKLLAVLAALLMFEIAAENAAAQDAVVGPGSFVPAFLDELYAIRERALKGDDRWVAARTKIQEIHL
jgi:thiamine-phosphate diphosphorylase/hydroxyethylthiazole kinase